MGPLVAGMCLLIAVVLPTSDSGADWAVPASAGGGRTLFVSAGARNGTGSADRPFGSLNAALVSAQPGGTISVAPGRYAGPVATVRAGRPGAPIVIHGWGAFLTGDGTGRLVSIGHSYVTLLGFDISKADKGIWIQRADHVRIVDNTVHHVGGECIRLKYRAVGNEIAGNRIGPCGLVGFDLGTGRRNGEGVYIGTAPEQLSRNPTPEADASDRNWVHDNTVDTPGECVDVKEGSTRNLVDHNTCTGGQDPNGSAFDSRGNGNAFLANTAIGEKGAGVRLGGDTGGDGLGNIVQGNMLTGNAGYGIKVMRRPQAMICDNDLSGNGSGPTNDASMRPTAVCPPLPLPLSPRLP